MKRQYAAAMALAVMGSLSIAAPVFARTIKVSPSNSRQNVQRLDNISAADRVVGTITRFQNEDWFSIRQDQPFDIDLKLTMNDDVDLELIRDRNGDCKPLGGDSKERISINEGDAPERINKKGLAAGCYLIGIIDSGGTLDDNFQRQDVDYELQVNIKTASSKSRAVRRPARVSAPRRPGSIVRPQRPGGLRR